MVGWIPADGFGRRFPIGKVLPFWDGRTAWGSGSLLGSFFTAIYIYISRYNIFTAIPPFSVHLGRQEWVDGTGCVLDVVPKIGMTYFRAFLTSCSG